MKELLGEGYSDYLNSFRSSSYKGLRVNENKITVESFLNLWKTSGFPELEKIPWIHNGFFIPNGFDAAETEFYQAGLYYIQEPAAMSPAEYLPVEEGDRVLDLCAAPGGKSTELLSKLHGTGVLFSNDISGSRAKALKKNLEMAGAANAYVTAEEPKTLSGFYPEYFQKILVDAPCSGEGMFRVQPAMMRHWEERGPEYYAPIQREILNGAYHMLAPGGMLMYSTCTFSKAEDEDRISEFLKKHSDMEPVPLPKVDGFERLKDATGAPGPYVRLYPHKIRGEGQFMALLKKKGPDSGITQEQETAKQSVANVLHEKTLWMREEEVYLLPGGTKPERGLHYLMTGLHIGTIKNGFLVPSQAYAMSLNKASWPDVLDLSAGDERIRKYLKGETIELSDSETIWNNKDRKKKKKGSDHGDNRAGKYGNAHGKNRRQPSLEELPKKDLTLVCVNGWPLGFGKRNRSLLKNMRNPGWRIQT